MENSTSRSPEAQAAIQDAWYETASALRAATVEVLELNDEDLPQVDENFWQTHSELFERLESEKPGIAEKIMVRFEALADERRQAAMVQFQMVELPRANRRAFWRGFLHPLG